MIKCKHRNAKLSPLLRNSTPDWENYHRPAEIPVRSLRIQRRKFQLKTREENRESYYQFFRQFFFL